MGTLIKENTSLGLAFTVTGLVHYPHSREHEGTQAEKVAENSTSRSKGSGKREALSLF